MTMTRQEIVRKARLATARTLRVGIERVREHAEFAGALGASPAALTDLRYALEAEFGVRFSDEQMAFCKTVGTAIDLVEAKLENRGLAA